MAEPHSQVKIMPDDLRNKPNLWYERKHVIKMIEDLGSCEILTGKGRQFVNHIYQQRISNALGLR